MDCEYCKNNRPYMLVRRMLRESEEREKIATVIINELRRKRINEDLVRDVLEAHAKILKKAPKENIIELIVEELKK